jgi:hypothetical protein
MTTIVPQFPIKIYQRQDEGYTSSMVAFIVVDDTDHWKSIFVQSRAHRSRHDGSRSRGCL